MSQSTSLVAVCPAYAIGQHLQQPGLPFADCLPATLIHYTARTLGASSASTLLAEGKVEVGLAD